MMGKTIPPNARLAVTFDCPACEGTGHAELRHYCGLCGADFSPCHLKEPPGSAVPTLPCGCDVCYWREEDGCGDCEGDGTFHRSLTLAELADLLKEMSHA